MHERLPAPSFTVIIATQPNEALPSDARVVLEHYPVWSISRMPQNLLPLRPCVYTFRSPSR
jgi:hypothetical protein